MKKDTQFDPGPHASGSKLGCGKRHRRKGNQFGNPLPRQ